VALDHSALTARTRTEKRFNLYQCFDFIIIFFGFTNFFGSIDYNKIVTYYRSLKSVLPRTNHAGTKI